LEDSVYYHCFEEKNTYYNEPIIQTPEKMQLKYILNISQQNIYIIHVMSGDEAIHSSIAKSPPRDFSLITCLETQLNVDIFENESKYFSMYILSCRD
jgi:hypothetical protein